MSPKRFEHVLAMVYPLISQNDIRFRKCISTEERYVLTIPIFASGDAQ